MGLSDRDYMRDRYIAREKIEDAKYNPLMFRSSASKKMNFQSIKALLIFGALVGVLVCIKFYLEKEDYPPLSLPNNGSVILYSPIYVTPPAPFKIISDQMHGDINYFVTVSDWDTHLPLMGIFVSNGQMAEVKIPLGTYRISIAEGKYWYGPQRLFGKKTVIYEGINPTLIYQSESNQFIGAIINLTGMINGNYPIKLVAR